LYHQARRFGRLLLPRGLLIPFAPNPAVCFVDGLQKRAKAGRLVYGPHPIQAAAKPVEVALRQQADGNYAFAVHAGVSNSIGYKLSESETVPYVTVL
jgi:hypothetical protein